MLNIWFKNLIYSNNSFCDYERNRILSCLDVKCKIIIRQNVLKILRNIFIIYKEKRSHKYGTIYQGQGNYEELVLFRIGTCSCVASKEGTHCYQRRIAHTRTLLFVFFWLTFFWSLHSCRLDTCVRYVIR